LLICIVSQLGWKVEKAAKYTVVNVISLYTVKIREFTW